MQRYSLSLCVSLIVWFCTFSSVLHVPFIYYFYIICQKRWNSRLYFSLRFSTYTCSLMCEKVKQDRFQLLLSFFPSLFISLCLQTTLYVNKKYSLSCFSWYKCSWVTDDTMLFQTTGFFWKISPLLSSSVSTDLVRSCIHYGSCSKHADLRLLLWVIVKIIVIRPPAILDQYFLFLEILWIWVVN